ncbi:carboxypeptidase M32 [Saccharibacillus sp. JS10]|uniref:carboxypeptidase M32 n=1 Tax=Saccharibacillus sp. JS10 TaxID=2950552 RepID=UPI00210CF7BC|nr:carboxypeptidase M32 [Saccharibacillus sp. JS10]MCQ4085638.1 carboxypeptidase M32 [Saccharibacillus sp. JS10]
MEQKLQEQWNGFRELVAKIGSYHEAVNLMYWDLRTGAPRKGSSTRAETIGLLSTEAFKLETSDEMGTYLQLFAQEENLAQLEDLDRRLLENVQKSYDQNRKIPEKEFKDYTVLTSKSETQWEEAKDSGDFESFEPYLTEIVGTLRKFVGYWGVKDTPYDTLLDMYEPDMTVERLDDVFDRLKKRLVPLAEAIAASEIVAHLPFLDATYPKEGQEAFSHFILKEMGYDFEAGRLDEAVHPFATGLNPGDVRITTHYHENDVLSAAFSSLHEGGHALYEQNIDPKLTGTPLAQGTSMGIHESQSRFWENMIGRSLPFWERYFGELQKQFPDQLTGVTPEKFHFAANRVENSLIRIEADELTYNLHIIIRYEIEKMLFNENLDVKKLPEVWNSKYESYLGITPPNHSEGVLQDVHWSGGAFGYFASYSLGNMYAAQMMRTMRKEMPNLDELIAQGNLLPIKEWLTEKVYVFGSAKKPSEIIFDVTGEELNPDYLADYLEQKYTSLYNLKL